MRFLYLIFFPRSKVHGGNCFRAKSYMEVKVKVGYPGKDRDVRPESERFLEGKTQKWLYLSVRDDAMSKFRTNMSISKDTYLLLMKDYSISINGSRVPATL